LNLWFPNCRGITREPEHERDEPSAVSSFTPEELDEDLGAGKTDTEAPESMNSENPVGKLKETRLKVQQVGYEHPPAVRSS